MKTVRALQIGHASHVGLVREINEDSYLVLVPPAVAPPVEALLLVADGVGGANAGEVASGLLVESFFNWFHGNRYGEEVHYNAGHPDYFVAALKDLLENVNERLYQMAATRPEWANMGTTATVALLSNSRLFIGHVGDTRGYLLRGGTLQQLTADHSWVAEEVAAGRMTEAQAQNHPKRNVISRVLGSSPLLRVDRKVYELEPQDIFLLASDGLTSLVTDPEIHQYILGSRTIQQGCNQLINLANQRGGHDNVTILAARLLNEEGQNNGRTTGGIATNGVAMQSVYLGQNTTPSTPGHAQQPKMQPRRAGPALRHARPPSGYAPRDKDQLGAALLILVAVLITAIALGSGTVAVIRNRLSFSIGSQIVDAAILAGLIVVLAIVIGFLLGYLSRQWLVERRQDDQRRNN